MFAVVLLIAATFSRGIVIPLSDGGVLSVKPASLLRKVISGSCNIIYRSKRGVFGNVILKDNFENGPFIVIQSYDADDILCLYDLEDMGLWLVKIRTSQNFKAFSPASHLNEFVISSPWEIEPGNSDDWKQIYEVLSTMSSNTYKRQAVPGLDLGLLRLYRDKNSVIKSVKEQASLHLVSGL